MDADDLPRRKNDALAALTAEDLDRLSQDELAERITALEAEIARTKSRMSAANAHRSAADALFGRK